MTTVEIRTNDGLCPSYVFRPTGGAPWPPVLVYMDGIGIRPAMLEIGERLADYGYFVLLPDLYYRGGAYEPMTFEMVTNPEKRKVLVERFMSTATSANVMSDTQMFLDFLAWQSDGQAGKIGTVGYCMGGKLSLTAAGTYPDRIAATASYHGGRLATDDPDSPHQLAPKMKARIYVAGAVGDDSFTDAMKLRLEDALTSAGVQHMIETYSAKHGWVFRDIPVFDAAAAERHWQTLTSLFQSALPALLGPP